jgi:DNA mismatch repair ATPase MutS
MQYKVLPGKAEKSYGLFVAEMLNFPSEILENARRKL